MNNDIIFAIYDEFVKTFGNRQAIGLNILNENNSINIHESATTALLFNILNKDTIFLDIGANNGYYTNLAYKICKIIYYFEPNPSLFITLREKFPFAIGFKSALGSKNCFSRLYLNRRDNGVSSLYTINNQTHSIPIKMARIDTLIDFNLNQKYIAKIDVEGWELEVLYGFGKLLLKLDIDIIFEYNKHIYYRNELNYNSVIDYLLLHNFTLYEIKNDGSILKINSYSDISQFICNIYAIREKEKGAEK